MAFSYRNPVESAINVLPTNFSDQILSSTSERILQRIEGLNDFFSFSLRKEVEEALIRKGIELAPVPYQVHSHPACKTIENHIIYRVVPMTLNKVPSVALISMREEKAEKLLKVRNFSRFGVIKALKPLNRCIDAKDFYRYMDPSSLSRNFPDLLSRFRSECNTNGWFPKVAFVHDELHFWEAKDVLKFFSELPEVSTLLGTVVCPPELLVGEVTSKNPRIYTFEIEGDSLHFFPDGASSEGYSQPVKTTTWWLKTSMISNGDLTLRVSILYSVFSHHLISVDRGSSLQSSFFFDKPDCLFEGELSKISSTLSGGLVERSTMSSILTYLSCLKTPNKESALAKLRQLEKRDLFPDEAFLVSSVSSTFIKYGLGKDLDVGLIDRFKEQIFELLPGVMKEVVNKKKHWEGTFRLFLKEICVKHFKVSRSVMHIYDRFLQEEPAFLFDDRPSKPYSFRRLSVPKNSLLTLGLSCILVSSDGSVFCPPLILVPRRGCVQSNPPSSGPFLLRAPISGDFERVSENSSRVDTFSSHGVVLESSVEVQEFVKSCIPYEQRRNCCVFDALSVFFNLEPEAVLEEVFNQDISSDLFDAIEEDKPLSLELIHEVALCLDCCCFILLNGVVRKLNLKGSKQAFIVLSNGHAVSSERKIFEGLVDSELLNVSQNPSNHSLNFPRHNTGSIPFCLKRAEKLMGSIKKGCTGILLEVSKESVERLSNTIEDFASVFRGDMQIHMSFELALGAPGSGKSQKIKKWLLDHPLDSCLVVSPRRALAAEWTEGVKGTSHQVCTFESALCKISSNFKGIVLDEISLYPPGFTDLLFIIVLLRSNRLLQGDFFLKNAFKEAFSSKTLKTLPIYVLGDPLQTSYYSSLDTLLLDKDHDISRLIGARRDELEYLWYSYRLPKGFERILEFQCVGESEFKPPRFFSEISATRFFEYDALLVASQEDKRNLNVPLLCMTFGESQGLTFKKKVLICLSNDTLLVSEQALIVAITRSTEGFDIFLNSNRSFEEIKVSTKKKMIGAILNRLPIQKQRLLNLIPHGNVDQIRLSGGLEEKASFDPFILPEIQPSFPVPDLELCEALNSGFEWFKTHLPLVGVNPLFSEVFEKMEAREKREFFHPVRGFSEQFPDTDKGLVEDVMGAGFRFDAIFPRHSGSDDVTFWEGVKKRLKFSCPRKERAKLSESRKYAPTLLKIFLQHLPNEFKVSQNDIELGLNSFNDKRAEKTEALWAAHSERSDIDWPIDHVFLFMKSQLCTKQEKMFTKAKAGQTLACFHHSVLFRFGPFLRAIEKAFLRSCGESYYIHSGKNFFCLNEFILKNSTLFQGNSVESDYEAFDSSQDSVILAFEEALLKHLGVSEGFISDYVKIKLNLGCRLGSLAIMRFTGEFCTFLFNTFANMLFTFLKYDVSCSKDRILFAGDDMASLGPLRSGKKENVSLLRLFSLKAKEEKKDIPCFCGWYLTPDGILKSPKLLWARICTMKQRGLLASCLDNYFLEAVFAYNLGEKLFSYFESAEIEYHYVVSRFFISNSYRFSGESKISYYGIKETFGSKCPLSRSMTLHLELKEKISKLIVSNHLTSMVTQGSFVQRYFKQSDVLNQISKLGIVKKVKWLFQISIFLMRWNLNLLKSNLQNSRTFTLVQSWCALHRLSQISGVLKARFSCMMRRLFQSRMALLQPMRSILRKDRLSLYFDQSICYRLMTLFFLKRLKLPFNLMMSTFVKTGKFLGSMLVVSTDFLTQLGIFVLAMVMGDGHNKKFGAATPSNFQVKLKGNSLPSLISLSSLCQIWMSNSSREDLFFHLDRLVGKNLCATQGSGLRKFVEGFLGQPQLELIRSYQRRRKMSSVQDVIQLAIRLAIDQWLWDQHIDPTHQILVEGTRLDQVPADRTEAANTVQVHFKKYLFGNIAILGSSGKTQWPNVEITLPQVTVRVEGQNVVKVMRLNLSVLLQALETFRASSQVQQVRGATFRQVCECYAPEAYMFLKGLFPTGVSTNIYKKWPRALESAPWVAFDFCSGLKMNELTPDEKKVIDRLTKRLFRTEGQKGIFEAGQEVNVDLEG
uniref:Polyprotein n=1 Tax=Hobart betaflexivirus 1 TaxID=2201305 RepID=A0A2U8JQC8_9VIRU|nr:polyprotein [Hobart betaflexivirus 1]